MGSRMFLVCTTSALVLGLGSLGCAGTQATARTREQVERSFRHAADQAADQIKTGWNTKQAKLFAAPFAPDGDYVAVTGHQVSGRGAIEAAHHGLFTGRYRQSTIELKVLRVRVLRPGVALAILGGHNTTTYQGQTEGWDFVISLVMNEGSDGWKIALFHNTRVE